MKRKTSLERKMSQGWSVGLRVTARVPVAELILRMISFWFVRRKSVDLILSWRSKCRKKVRRRFWGMIEEMILGMGLVLVCSITILIRLWMESLIECSSKTWGANWTSFFDQLEAFLIMNEFNRNLLKERLFTIARRILKMIDIWSVKRIFRFMILIQEWTKLSKFTKEFWVKTNHKKQGKFSPNQKFMTFNFLIKIH